MKQYRVTKGKAFTADNEPIPVGTILEFDEVPAFLVGKVEEVPDGLEPTGEVADLNAKAAADAKIDAPKTDAPKIDDAKK